MADLGAIGFNTATMPGLLHAMGPPWWWTPFVTAIVKKNETVDGPQPAVAGYASGAFPAVFVTIILGEFGQGAGGVSIF